jgi:hypothetical protein
VRPAYSRRIGILQAGLSRAIEVLINKKVPSLLLEALVQWESPLSNEISELSGSSFPHLITTQFWLQIGNSLNHRSAIANEENI